MEVLSGGREAGIFRDKDKLYRPAGRWTPAVHKLLQHLDAVGFSKAPKVYGINEQGDEILSYLEGEVCNYPLVGNIASSQALISAAKLLREYHDATSDFIVQHDLDALEWMLPSREPMEVICHGDFAPYNVVLEGEQVSGVIDFDTAHPAPRSWDIAYALYCWTPFKTDEVDAMGNLASQIERAKQFCDAYGLGDAQREGLVDVMLARIQALVDFMHHEAQTGNQAFIANINDGHHLAYLADMDYLRDNRAVISQGLRG
ncbi:phosphotransferase enzyme family protein [Motilimonas sp. KMU-193]|uniref:phosphotransferase enzyme family protein n=1 Tax=Motilimonas sp. KMU-193 TaxID=3388668 RepID=UPI00396B2620